MPLAGSAAQKSSANTVFTRSGRPQLYRPLHNFQSKFPGIALERVVNHDSETIQVLDAFVKESDTVTRKGEAMNNAAGSSYFNNGFNADTVCQHCEGLVEHEPWCMTREPRMHYAYQIVVDPSKLTLADTLLLHSLGVAWTNNATQKVEALPR
jgi:hypothetical protein